MLVQKGLLHPALSKLKHIIDSRSALPALESVKLEADGTNLTLTATDLSTWLRVRIPSQGALEACLPLPALLDAVKPANRADKNAMVEITPGATSQELLLSTGGAKLTLVTLPAQDFPRWPGLSSDGEDWRPDGTWDLAAWHETVRWVAKAAGQDTTRPHLTTIFFDNEAVVATDGHRLHVGRLEGLDSGPTAVPSKSILALLRVLPEKGTLTVRRMKNLLLFSAADWEGIAKIAEETFPPYEMVIPNPSWESFHAIIASARLADALKQLPRLPGGRMQGVKLRVNGQILLERETDLGKASVEVEAVDSTHRGKELEIGLDGRYVRDALSGGDELCTIRFGGALDPVRIDHDDGRVGVLMPLRI